MRSDTLLPLVLTLTFSSISIASDDAAFARVRPVLARCVACHNTDDASGDLDLTNRESAMRGGESGPVIKPGDPEASSLYKLVATRKMPPKKPLSADEAGLIRDWIKSGAAWEGTLVVAREQDDTDSPRWALRPIVSGETPEVKHRDWVKDPIDAHILHALEAKKLEPSAPANRETWIRRVTIDLTGLPPTPEEIQAFETDTRSGAFERVVDRLLDSPRYGERWARHWLDLARFAESHGFEYDRLRDNAWRYRDYVIKSFNQDKPYAQFMREQVAGDVIQPVTADGIIATGFLVAGPWDQAGSGQANLIGRGKIREEELEDVVGVVGQTFLGLTVQCARCHSHKFDPIPQRDYYRIKSAFEGVGHGDRPALADQDRLARDEQRRTLAADLSGLESKLSQLEHNARSRALSARSKSQDHQNRPQPKGLWTFETDARDELGSLNGTLVGKASIGRGRLILPGADAYLKTAPLVSDLKEKTLETWLVLADNNQRGGSAVSVEREGGPFDGIVFGEIQPGKWMAGSEFYNRTKDVAGIVEPTKPGTLIHLAISYLSDGTIQLFRNGTPYGKPYKPSGPASTLQTYSKGAAHLLFGLRHKGAANGYLRGEIEEVRLYDHALNAEEITASFKSGPERITSEEIEKSSDEPTRQERRSLTERMTKIRAKLQELSSLPEVYAATPFNPPITKILNRGDFETPGEPVSAGALSAVRQPSADFGLKPDAPEAERRLKLADWLADPKNPLPARVMVNRLWHYHFGTGIVATPSDLGANGGRPSHPALLDQLAADFLAGGGKLKPMHRRIVLSNTYRQSSKFNPKAAAIDADSRLLWRFPPRRIEGEAVLDSMLATTGRLNPEMGGPSFRPFTVTVFNSNFYNLTDPEGVEYRRRTIYRIHVHSARSPLMEGLDCPDPSVKTAKRSSTVTPLQALALMNDTFVERQARWFADRVKSEVGTDPKRQVKQAYLLAFGRQPTPTEIDAAEHLIQRHPLDRLTWALLNSNEFLYLR